MFIEEKEHWIFVYQERGSDVNICDSLRNNGKQDYPGNTFEAIRIACCMDSAIKVSYLPVQQQSNSIDCGGLSHCLFCRGLFWITTKWKLLWRSGNAQPPVNASTTTAIITFSEDFKEDSTLQTFSTICWYILCTPAKLFLWEIGKIVLVTLWLDVLFVVSSLKKMHEY